MNSLLLFSFAGCECCGISSWYRESRLESLHDILMTAATQQQDLNDGCDESVQLQVLEQGEPLAPRGICQPCVDMLHTGKGYCSVCYKKYIDDTPLFLPPGKNKLKILGEGQNEVPVQAMGASVAEEAQQMVCCDECNEWVHSKCEGIDMSQYESIANGTHPVWVSDYCMLSDVTVLAII